MDNAKPYYVEPTKHIDPQLKLEEMFYGKPGERPPKLPPNYQPQDKCNYFELI